MNKAQLIDAVATNSGLTKADAKKAVDAFIKATTQALKNGERVSLVGFGSFTVSKRTARIGRNPFTGGEIKISAKKVVKFKAADKLSRVTLPTIDLTQPPEPESYGGTDDGGAFGPL